MCEKTRNRWTKTVNQDRYPNPCEFIPFLSRCKWPDFLGLLSMNLPSHLAPDWYTACSLSCVLWHD